MSLKYEPSSEPIHISQVLQVLAGGLLQCRVPERALEAAQEGLQEVEPGAVSRVFERMKFLAVSCFA